MIFNEFPRGDPGQCEGDPEINKSGNPAVPTYVDVGGFTPYRVVGGGIAVGIPPGITRSGVREAKEMIISKRTVVK